MTAAGGVEAAGGALCPIPPRLTDDSREEPGGGANIPKVSKRKLTSGKTKGTGTHERQVPAEQRVAAASGCLREEHWPAAGRPQEEGSLGAGPQEGGSLGTGPQEVPQECSPGARAEGCLLVASQLPVAAR